MPRPDQVLADKAYSSKANRARLRRRGIRGTIPVEDDQAANRKELGSRGDRCVHGGQAWEPVGGALAADLGLAGFDDPPTCPGGYLGIVRLVDVHPAAGCCAPWGSLGPGVYHWP